MSYVVGVTSKTALFMVYSKPNAVFAVTLMAELSPGTTLTNVRYIIYPRIVTSFTVLS